MFSGVNKYIYSHTETRERKNEAERSGYGEFARPCTQAANSALVQRNQNKNQSNADLFRKNDRMVTKYMVYEYRPDEKPKNVTLLETYQIADVVKLLAGLYSDGG